MINVLGDSLGSGIVEKLAAKQLEQMDREENVRRSRPGVGFNNQAYLGSDGEIDKTRL